MSRLSFSELCRLEGAVLTDGAIETRLIHEFRRSLPEFASFLPLFEPGGRDVLERLYRGYLEIAADAALPMQIGTPTWRAHPDCLQRLGFTAAGDLARVNETAVALLRDLRTEMRLEPLVYIAGVIGPRRDGYDPAGAPNASTARSYHAAQAELLAGAGIDLLYAPTFASADELRGVAAAMAATGLPYVVAPVLDQRGTMPDGTDLATLVADLDSAPHAPPLHVMIGCVHPTGAGDVLAQFDAYTLSRVVGLKANASALPPAELERLDRVDADPPPAFAAEMLRLHRMHGLKVLGGCCGTDQQHVRAIAMALRGMDGAILRTPTLPDSHPQNRTREQAP